MGQKIGEIFKVDLTDLYKRLDKTKEFKTGNKTLDELLRSLPPSVRNIALNTGVGIEIEVENCPGSPVEDWHIDSDGSLRNLGMEYKTTYGHRAFHTYKSLIRLHQYLTHNGCVFSERTSVHVHVDVRDLTKEQLWSMLLVYAAIEPMLFRYAGEKRKHNIFCVPFCSSSTYVKSKDKDFGVSINHIMFLATKYTAFNMACIKDFGTVEFRHMQGNSDPNYIFPWVMMLVLLKTFVKQHTLQEICELLCDLKSRSFYGAFIDSVFFGFSRYLQLDANAMSKSLSQAKLLMPEEF